MLDWSTEFEFDIFAPVSDFRLTITEKFQGKNMPLDSSISLLELVPTHS